MTHFGQVAQKTIYIFKGYFFQNYSIITKIIDINWIPKNMFLEISKNQSGWTLRGKNRGKFKFHIVKKGKKPGITIRLSHIFL